MKRVLLAGLRHVPPPVVGIAMLLTAWLVQRAHGPRPGPGAPIELAIAALLLGSGVAMAASTIVYLVASRTTVVPHGEPRRLLVGGPFRLTRNPIYVGALLAYVGVAVGLRLWFALPLVVVPIAFVAGVVVPMEEAALRTAFGRDYDDYCARVRRWLG